MKIPTCAVPVLTMFCPGSSTPTYHRLLVLALAAVLTTGRRTVTNLLRTVRMSGAGACVVLSSRAVPAPCG